MISEGENVIELVGDQVITGSVTFNSTIIVKGNLFIPSGAELILDDDTLIMKCEYDGQYRIQVNTSGRFDVLNGSVVMWKCLLSL